MIFNDFLPALKAKQFFRFTGPPEHWLTAIKYLTWGLKFEYENRWQKIEVGDIFLMHSTTKSKFKNAKSAIIGIGVIGTGMRQKDHFLWQEEFEKKQNIYPLLVPFSEIYLFSSIANLADWSFHDTQKTERLVRFLLNDAVPLPTGFPVMGSISRVDNKLALEILGRGLPSHSIDAEFNIEDFRGTHTPLKEIKTSAEALRFIPTLKFLKKAQSPTLQKDISIFERDNELLERANIVHRQVIDKAIDILRRKGFTTSSNMHADLVGENENEILLFEAKSIPDNRFRVQARTAVGQLYQYQYFDINDHQQKQQTSKPVHKCLLIPDDPGDALYIKFLEWANITTNVPQDDSLITL